MKNSSGEHKKLLTSQQRKALIAILSEHEKRRRAWRPLIGPQTLAYNSEADVLFYGGQAGGGKTDLLLGVAHTSHHRSIIFRREYPQLKGIEDRSQSIFSGLAKYSMFNKTWRFY